MFENYRLVLSNYFLVSLVGVGYLVFLILSRRSLLNLIQTVLSLEYLLYRNLIIVSKQLTFQWSSRNSIHGIVLDSAKLESITYKMQFGLTRSIYNNVPDCDNKLSKYCLVEECIIWVSESLPVNKFSDIRAIVQGTGGRKNIVVLETRGSFIICHDNWRSHYDDFSMEKLTFIYQKNDGYINKKSIHAINLRKNEIYSVDMHQHIITLESMERMVDFNVTGNLEFYHNHTQNDSTSDLEHKKSWISRMFFNPNVSNLESMIRSFDGTGLDTIVRSYENSMRTEKKVIVLEGLRAISFFSNFNFCNVCLNKNMNGWLQTLSDTGLAQQEICELVYKDSGWDQVVGFYGSGKISGGSFLRILRLICRRNSKKSFFITLENYPNPVLGGAVYGYMIGTDNFTDIILCRGDRMTRVNPIKDIKHKFVTIEIFGTLFQ